ELEASIALDQLGERLAWPAQPAVGQRLAEQRGGLSNEAHHRGDDRRDQLVLAREVAVHGAGAQIRLAEDVLHRGPVKALAREAAQGGGQDLAPARRDVLLCDLWHSTSILALTANGRSSITNEASFSFPGGFAVSRSTAHRNRWK